MSLSGRINAVKLFQNVDVGRIKGMAARTESFFYKKKNVWAYRRDRKKWRSTVLTRWL